MSNDPDADVDFIRALAELIRDSDLNEIAVKRDYGEAGALNVRLSRGVPAAAAMPPMVMQAPAPAPAAPAAEPAAPAPAEDPADHPGAVTSPMVGTVYLSSEPAADPFVRPGDAVTEGQTLLIIEAMKTMNQIPAPRAGTVKRILVENAAPVEYGTALMIIE